MEKAVLIITRQLERVKAYRIYELNSPFSVQLDYQFADGARLLLTNESGRSAFLKPLWSQHRKLGQEVFGLHRNIEDQVASVTIIQNLQQMIATGAIDLPHAISHILSDDGDTANPQLQIDPQLN